LLEISPQSSTILGKIRMLFRSTGLVFAIFAACIVLAGFARAGETSDRETQTILHMLDYVSVDYGGAVLYGKVLNESEFTEQLGFADQAADLVHRMPDHPNKAVLVAQAAEIATLVRGKAPADHVSILAQRLRGSIIEAYQVPVAPRRLPEPLPAMAIFQQLCVPCHGATGHGDGQFSSVLNPKPADFHDEVRMGQRSVYALYSSISLGIGNKIGRAHV
jgi:high-affinity iron transporter